VLVYKRVTALAGHTSRVAELLEAVARMSAPNASSYHREVTPPATCHCQGSICLLRDIQVHLLYSLLQHQVGVQGDATLDRLNC
jgi:hypothetical protein